jgi:hypothetical protein
MGRVFNRTTVRGCVCAVALLVLLAGCGSKRTIIEGSSGGELANNGFPIPGDTWVHYVEIPPHTFAVRLDPIEIPYDGSKRTPYIPQGFVCPTQAIGTTQVQRDPDPIITIFLLKECYSGAGGGGHAR